MSCGHPHETDCSSVLDRIYEYIDHEMAEDDCATVKKHLDECAPCLAEFGLEVDDIRERFSTYIDRYDVPVEALGGSE